MHISKDVQNYIIQRIFELEQILVTFFSLLFFLKTVALVFRVLMNRFTDIDHFDISIYRFNQVFIFKKLFKTFFEKPRKWFFLEYLPTLEGLLLCQTRRTLPTLSDCSFLYYELFGVFLINVNKHLIKKKFVSFY